MLMFGVACHQEQPDSKISTLDDLMSNDAGGSLDVCGGDRLTPNGMVVERAFASSRSYRIMMDRAIQRSLSAVPEIIKASFKDHRGKIILHNDSRKICVGKAKVSLDNCFVVDQSGPRIYLQPNPSQIRDGLVRAFGIYFSEYAVRVKEGRFLRINDELARDFDDYLVQLKSAFEQDIVLLQGENAPLLGQVDQHRVFAEAFDSYYCNDDTHLSFQQKYPNLYPEFEAWASQMGEADEKAFVGVQSLTLADGQDLLGSFRNSRIFNIFGSFGGNSEGSLRERLSSNPRQGGFLSGFMERVRGIFSGFGNFPKKPSSGNSSSSPEPSSPGKGEESISQSFEGCKPTIGNSFVEDGPFTVEKTKVGRYDFYEPQSSDGCKFPLVGFAMGTFTSKTMYTSYYNHLASQGIAVVVDPNMSALSGGTLITALKTVLEEKSDVLTGKVGTMGHSQGGAGALNATSFEKIDAVVGLMPGQFEYKGRREVAYLGLAGGRDMFSIFTDPSLRSFRSIKGSKFYAKQSGASHILGASFSTSARNYSAMSTAFFQCYLNDHTDACQLFENGTCEAFRGDWTGCKGERL